MTSHDVTIAGYVVILVAVLALEVAAAGHVRGIVSIRTVLARIMRTRSGRVGVLAAWAWLGMHFFAR
jgi:hypothetical protein